MPRHRNDRTEIYIVCLGKYLQFWPLVKIEKREQGSVNASNFTFLFAKKITICQTRFSYYSFSRNHGSRSREKQISRRNGNSSIAPNGVRRDPFKVPRRMSRDARLNSFRRRRSRVQRTEFVARFISREQFVPRYRFHADGIKSRTRGTIYIGASFLNRYVTLRETRKRRIRRA